MSQVRAAVVVQQGEQWGVERVDLDETVGGDEVLVQVSAAGLCHSDEHLRVGALPGRFPLVGGHEGSGVVIAVGEQVTHVGPGDRVTFCFRPACGECAACLDGRSQLCEKSAELRSDRVLRHFRRDGEPAAATNLIGAFAERTVMPGYSVVPVPADVSDEVAAILGCAVITGYGAAARAAAVGSGDVVLVLGAGGVGIAAIQTAVALGAVVIAVDTSTVKQQLARQFGARWVAGSVADAVATVRTAAPLEPNVAIVTAGVPGLAEQAARALRPGGRIVLAALGDPATLSFAMPVNEIVVRNLTVTGSIYGNAQVHSDIPAVIDLARSGALDLERMVTGRYRLEEIVGGYTDLHRAQNVVRNVVLMR